MPQRDRAGRGPEAALLKRFTNTQRLGEDRSGHASVEHVRHQLYVGRDRETRANALIKIATKPGLVYQHDLTNEIATLSTINRDLPDSRHFPLLWEDGRLPDGRVFLIMSLFDEWPLETTIGEDRLSDRLVAQLKTALEVATALAELHRIQVFHVDLNPMNILYRPREDTPIIRIVDFESSYEVARHGAGGAFYNPPTTSGFSAPEVTDRAPDGRADIFSLGAVLYTMVAGHGAAWDTDWTSRIEADDQIDAQLRSILLTAVQRDVEKRFASVGAMHEALEAYLEAIWPGRART